MSAFENMRGEWRLAAPALREVLTQDLLQLVLPPYADFYRAHSNEQFSKKHMNEYLVYDPSSVEKILYKFFDNSK
jgi:hypothetical protein